MIIFFKKVGEGEHWEFRTDIYALLTIRYILKDLLFAQGSLRSNWKNLFGKSPHNRIDICLCMTDSSSCKPKTTQQQKSTLLQWKVETESVSCSAVSDSLRSHGLSPAMLPCPWNSPGKNTGGGCHSLLQGSSWPRDWTRVSCIAGRFITFWATREAQ